MQWKVFSAYWDFNYVVFAVAALNRCLGLIQMIMIFFKQLLEKQIIQEQVLEKLEF